MQLRIQETWAGVRDSRTRLPFRYGKACLTRCPQLLLAVELETPFGRARGHAADCLPPSWFDKRGSKSYGEQLEDLTRLIRLAMQTFEAGFDSFEPFFPRWHELYQQLQDAGRQSDDTALAVSFSVSLLERAIIDGVCRAVDRPFHDVIKSNALGLDGGRIHTELAGSVPADWIVDKPHDSIWVRHTIGLADPLTLDDLAREPDLIPDDTWPKALEDYLQHAGVRYLKIKVSNQLDRDLDRLTTIARLMSDISPQGWTVTLDGNEQYQDANQIHELIEECRRRPELQTLVSNIVWIEQPIERSLALEPEVTASLQQSQLGFPVIIDESDGELNSFSQARRLGYGGTSVKSCKGILKGLLNAGLIRKCNDQAQGREPNRPSFVLSAEDLCCVGTVSVQTDLCFAASLGIQHAERNGHHFHPGLSYLTKQDQMAALKHHPDFYEDAAGIVAPNLKNGQFKIESILKQGFGFQTAPDEQSFLNLNDWNATEWERDK